MKINLYPYFQLLRVGDARGYFLIAFFGFFLVKGFLAPIENIIIFFGMIFFLFSFSFSINDCFDQKEDKFDKTKKNPIVLKKVSFKKALFFSFSLAALGLILSSFLGLKIFLFYLLITSLFLFYTAPPLRLKSRFPLDIITHALIVPVSFGLLIIIFKTEIPPLYYLIIASLFFFSVILDLRNQWEDYATDRGAGRRNTFNVLGYKTAKRLLISLAALYPLIFLLIFYLISRQFFVLFLIVTFVFLALFLFNRNHRLVKNYKILDAYAILSYGLFLVIRQII